MNLFDWQNPHPAEITMLCLQDILQMGDVKLYKFFNSLFELWLIIYSGKSISLA